MMGLLAGVLLMLMLVLLAPAKPMEDRHHNGHSMRKFRLCGSGQYQVTVEGVTRCANCTICEQGQGFKTKCGFRDTKCKECRDGETYSMYLRGQRRCQPCTKCTNMEEIRPCTVYEDSQCGQCLQGFYYSAQDQTCEKCSYCYPEHEGLAIPMAECKTNPHPHYRCLPVHPEDLAIAMGQSESSTISVLEQLLKDGPIMSRDNLRPLLAIISMLLLILIILVSILIHYACKLRSRLLMKSSVIYLHNNLKDDNS